MAFVLCKKGVKILVFCIGVHIDEKKLLKYLPFHKNLKHICHQPIVVVLLEFFYYRVNDSELKSNMAF